MADDEQFRKAVILLSTLDDATVDRLLDQFDPGQATRIRDALVRLDAVENDERQDVVNDFLRSAKRSTSDDGGVELAGSLAGESHRHEAPAAEASPFDFLHQSNPQQIAPLLASERPQTIALVISRLPSTRAAEVLADLEPRLQAEVIRRLTECDAPSPDVLNVIEHGLRSRHRANHEQEHRRANGLATVERILAAADEGLARRLRENLAAHDAGLADLLPSPPKMEIEFAELNHLDDPELWQLLVAADGELLLLALAGASTSFNERVMRILPQADAQRLQRALRKLGPTRLSDLEDAKREMAALAVELDADGVITLPHRALTEASR